MLLGYLKIMWIYICISALKASGMLQVNKQYVDGCILLLIFDFAFCKWKRLKIIVVIYVVTMRLTISKIKFILSFTHVSPQNLLLLLYALSS